MGEGGKGERGDRWEGGNEGSWRGRDEWVSLHGFFTISSRWLQCLSWACWKGPSNRVVLAEAIKISSRFSSRRLEDFFTNFFTISSRFLHDFWFGLICFYIENFFTISSRFLHGFFTISSRFLHGSFTMAFSMCFTTAL